MQYREVQSYESPRFLSYFPHFVTLQGGISTGFHHVSSPPPLGLHRLYHIKAAATGRDDQRTHFLIRQVGSSLTIPPNELCVTEASQVKADAASVQNAEGDVLVLDKGSHVWQFNRKGSAGKERFRAAEFTRNIIEERQKTGQFKAIGTYRDDPRIENRPQPCISC